MKEAQIALNILTSITNEKVVNSKEYEQAINALCELHEKFKNK